MSVGTTKLDRVLDAAYACFTRHGVRRTTMDDIAREARMSRPAVYQHVRNKEDAFRRLAGRLLEESLAGARAAAEDTGGDLAARLGAALEAKLGMTARLWRDSPAHAAELLGDHARTAADLVADYDAAMRGLLADLLREHGTGPAEAGELAEILMALTRGLEADLTDPDAPTRRLRHGVALLAAGLDTSSKESQ